ncbi:hypothetical protein [Kribbella sp. NBC_00359]|uniref:hypothetical protein n=1 Tax=Kribbella sp. NBC_00359 TaxID=2975966 RepID=UPI002E2512CA
MILWGLAAAAAAYAWSLQVDYADVPAGSTDWWIFSGSTRTIMRRVGICCTVIMILIPASLAGLATIRARRARQRETAQIAQRVRTINSVIAPLAAHLQRLAHLDPGETLPRERLAGEAVKATLAGLFDLHGGWSSQVRVCFFRVEGEAPDRRLVPENHHGRGKKSTCTVYEGDGGRGTEAFRALDARQARSWQDGNGEAEPSGWSRDKEYKSFLAVYVATETVLFGMITMDAIDPEAFHPKVDLPTVQTVADLYAAILAGLSAPKDHPDLSGATFEQ